MKKQNKIARAAQKTAKVSGLLLSSFWCGVAIAIWADKIRQNTKKIAKVIAE